MTPKPNITLNNLADTKNIGLFLSVKKGLNELFNRKIVKSSALSTSKSCYEYQDFLSVIICTTGSSSKVRAAVKSLINQDFPTDKYEIIVVNNGSLPFDYKESNSNFPNLRIVHEPVLGLSKARNTGAKAAKGEFILYMDDDAIANESLLKYIYTAFKEHKGFSIIGGQIFLRIPSPAPDVFLKSREALWSGYTVPYKHFRRIREHYEFPYGACFAVRHSSLDLLGGFSEDYGRRGRNFAGGEETALCFKALKYGLKIGIEPRASVTHCVEEHRFSKEHIEKTIRMGILTTDRLCKDGYAPYIWTKAYIKERIKILNSEIERLKSKNNGLAVFYKECELSAFEEIL